MFADPRDKAAEEGHTWDVHVRAIDIVARRQEKDILAIGLLVSRPWPVPPGKEDNADFARDVRV